MDTIHDSYPIASCGQAPDGYTHRYTYNIDDMNVNATNGTVVFNGIVYKLCIPCWIGRFPWLSKFKVPITHYRVNGSIVCGQIISAASGHCTTSWPFSAEIVDTVDGTIRYENGIIKGIRYKLCVECWKDKLPWLVTGVPYRKNTQRFSTGQRGRQPKVRDNFGVETNAIYNIRKILENNPIINTANNEAVNYAYVLLGFAMDGLNYCKNSDFIDGLPQRKEIAWQELGGDNNSQLKKEISALKEQLKSEKDNMNRAAQELAVQLAEKMRADKLGILNNEYNKESGEDDAMMKRFATLEIE